MFINIHWLPSKSCNTAAVHYLYQYEPAECEVEVEQHILFLVRGLSTVIDVIHMNLKESYRSTRCLGDVIRDQGWRDS